MPTYKKTVKAGKVIEIEYVRSKRIGAKNAFRDINKNTTSEAKALKNYYAAVKKLARKINANFKKDDLFITLTFRGKQPSYEEADKLLKKFIRAVRTVRQLRNMDELKWVAVIEDQKRIHVHVLLSKMCMDEVQDLWIHGKVIASRLEPNGEYTGLCHYITKEPKEVHKKRWKQSRNLIEPTVEYEEVGEAEAENESPEIKGYKKIYETYRYIDDVGLYRYAKYVRYGHVDMGMGKKEIVDDT